MRVLITGANGFVGQRLVRRLRDTWALAEGAPPLEQLTLLDVAAGRTPEDPRVRSLAGDLTDPGVLTRAVHGGVDTVFHLASVPGGRAEAEFDLGRRVNLDGTIALLDALRSQPRPPVVVFASSIAVFGTPMPDHIDDDTLPMPSMSYGAQKLMGEILMTDYSRRGWVDARSVRLAGVLARPRQPSGLITPLADALGFRHDGTAREFVQRALAA